MVGLVEREVTFARKKVKGSGFKPDDWRQTMYDMSVFMYLLRILLLYNSGHSKEGKCSSQTDRG